jgi:IMP dehydrogenase/GMP reductase
MRNILAGHPSLVPYCMQSVDRCLREGRGGDGIETDNARHKTGQERERIEIKEMGVKETISPEQRDRQQTDTYTHRKQVDRIVGQKKEGR